MCALVGSNMKLKWVGPCLTSNVKKEATYFTPLDKITCPSMYMPVCGKDSVTYHNSCTLNRNKMDIAYEGPCGNNPFSTVEDIRLCNCQNESFAPVCTLNGLTLENKCLAKCNK